MVHEALLGHPHRTERLHKHIITALVTESRAIKATPSRHGRLVDTGVHERVVFSLNEKPSLFREAQVCKPDSSYRSTR